MNVCFYCDELMDECECDECPECGWQPSHDCFCSDEENQCDECWCTIGDDCECLPDGADLPGQLRLFEEVQ